LVVVIKAIATDSNASVTMKDPTGEIQGTIHYSALDTHPNLIKRGAVLFLRQASPPSFAFVCLLLIGGGGKGLGSCLFLVPLQVSVFTPAPGSHYLNITDTNIIHIFPQNLPLPQVCTSASSSSSSFVRDP
jgi:hypothetical protein